jgi:hypothetical protein
MHHESDCNDDDTGSQSSEATEPPCKKKNPANPQAYNVRTSHALYIYLREEYGMQAISRVKKRNQN